MLYTDLLAGEEKLAKNGRKRGFCGTMGGRGASKGEKNKENRRVFTLGAQGLQKYPV